MCAHTEQSRRTEREKERGEVCAGAEQSRRTERERERERETFCFCKSNPLFLFFSSYILAYISNSSCTTCLILLYIIIITIIILFLSVNTYMHYL